MIYYLVEGINPEPWEAPTASIGRKNGKHYVHMHKNDSVRSYQDGFRIAFLQQNPDSQLFDGDVELNLYFWRQRDTETKAKSADATNLQKATEDALQGLLFQNDRSVIKVASRIMEQEPETEPKVLIGIQYLLPPRDEILEMAARLHREPEEPTSNLRSVPDVF